MLKKKKENSVHSPGVLSPRILLKQIQRKMKRKLILILALVLVLFRNYLILVTMKNLSNILGDGGKRIKGLCCHLLIFTLQD